MDVRYLKKHELIYEILARKFKLDGTEEVAELRPILRQLLKGDVKVPEEKCKLEAEELEGVQATLDDVNKLVDSYPGKDAKVLTARINTRLEHVLGRLNRYDDTDERTKTQITDLKNTCVRYKARLEAREVKIVKSMSSTFLGTKLESENEDSVSDESESGDDFPISSSPRILRIQKEASNLGVAPSRSRVQVYKWGLTFSGTEKPEAVVAFLERVEELRVARGASKELLFQSAVDLFTGDAIAWYRSIKSRVHSWEELVGALRVDFLPADFDDLVWEEVRARKHSKGEKVGVYIAVMENLFSRLTIKPDESSRLRIIKKNLQSVYIARLSLVEVNSIRELGVLCRKIEDTLAPPKDGMRSQIGNRINIVTGLSKRLECWNCKKEGHTFNKCTKPLQKFCFACGKANETSRSCSCQRKN